MSIVGLTFTTSLGLVHIFGHRLRWIELIPQKRWLSFGAGVSIAYLFVDVLPLLSEGQKNFEATRSGGLSDALSHHIYLIALAGLAVFYVLELIASRSRASNREVGDSDQTSANIFWVHIGSFALYNGLLGYLLREAETHGLMTCVLLFIALALHFVVNDQALREHHKTYYDRVGRWLLAAAVMGGYLIGTMFMVGETTIAILWSFVAGGLILNVLKDEVPEHRDTCLWSFLSGLAGYATLLVVVAH